MPRPPDVMNLVAWLFALWLAVATALLVLLFVHPSVRFHWTTDVYLAAIVLFSLLAFCAMGWDKYRAKNAKRRVPEHVLHTFEFLGGWPGSLIGQRTFHHKTRKLTYQGIFWGIVGVHLALLAWLTYLWWTTPTVAPTPEPTTAAEPAEG